eukprot:Rmarinus@m.12032
MPSRSPLLELRSRSPLRTTTTAPTPFLTSRNSVAASSSSCRWLTCLYKVAPTSSPSSQALSRPRIALPKETACARLWPARKPPSRSSRVTSSPTGARPLVMKASTVGLLARSQRTLKLSWTTRVRRTCSATCWRLLERTQFRSCLDEPPLEAAPST